MTVPYLLANRTKLGFGQNTPVDSGLTMFLC
jgi:hypothetical protein